jgi:selenium metabolism protein YedF
MTQPDSGRTQQNAPAVLTITSDTMGRGDEALGAILMRSFLHTLAEAKTAPRTIIFYNTAVKLVAEGSPVLEDLRALAERGVELLACGTCLGHFDLKESVAAGEISNMYTIAEHLLSSDRVVNLG